MTALTFTRHGQSWTMRMEYGQGDFHQATDADILKLLHYAIDCIEDDQQPQGGHDDPSHY